MKRKDFSDYIVKEAEKNMYHIVIRNKLTNSHGELLMEDFIHVCGERRLPKILETIEKNPDQYYEILHKPGDSLEAKKVEEEVAELPETVISEEEATKRVRKPRTRK